MWILHNKWRLPLSLLLQSAQSLGTALHEQAAPFPEWVSLGHVLPARGPACAQGASGQYSNSGWLWRGKAEERNMNSPLKLSWDLCDPCVHIVSLQPSPARFITFLSCCSFLESWARKRDMEGEVAMIFTPPRVAQGVKLCPAVRCFGN